MTLPVLAPYRRSARPVETAKLRALFVEADGALFPRMPGTGVGELGPDPDLLGAFVVLERRFTMALVTPVGEAGTEARLRACALDQCFPQEARFCGDGPCHDAATWRGAVARRGCFPDEGLAVVADVPAALAAVAAGLTTVGNLQYVPPEHHRARQQELLDAGAASVVTSWEHLLVALLD